MASAHLSIVLHAHLPFVRHPEHEFHLEELWYYEAMHETYLPLLEVLDRLEEDEVPGAMTLSISAPLLAMMEDELLSQRFIAQLDRMIGLSAVEIERAEDQEALLRLGNYYLDRFQRLKTYYVETLNKDVISRFRHHSESGRLELMTCVGTHPILPFMATKEGRQAQISAGIEYFESLFGKRPRGIWIAECAFAPGVDELLAREGIGFACLEENGITCASSRPVYGNYAPLISPYGVAFFGRDQQASAQVWSASEGYPGDFDYREFYRDRGYDLPAEVARPFMHPDGFLHNTGLKFHRVTGKVELDKKDFYDPQKAMEKVKGHAAHFLASRKAQAGSLEGLLGTRPAHITCPYDAELFGHWWFEGPLFLEALFREAASCEEVIMSTPVIYLKEVDSHQMAMPAISTWGEESYFAVWLDESNAWIYRHLRNREEQMVDLANDLLRKSSQGEILTELQLRAFKQAARELLLAQSSDWPFIIKTGTTVEYAEERLIFHLEAFDSLLDMIGTGEVNDEELSLLEERDNLFQSLDPFAWATL